MENTDGSIKTNLIKEILFEIKERCGLDITNLEIIRAIFFTKFKNYDLITKKNELIVSDLTNEKLWQKFYITKKIENLSENTLTTYLGVIRNFSRTINNKPFIYVTTDDIRMYLATKMIKNPDIKPSSLDNERRFMKSFFNFLEEEGFITKNPINKIKKVKGKITERTAFTSMEIEQIRQACKNKMETAIVEVFLSTGFRNMEVVNIKLSDIDFEKKQIRTIGKGNKIGYGYLNAKAILALKDYINNERNPKNEDEDTLFLREYKRDNRLKGILKNSRNLDREPLCTGYMGLLIRKLGKRAGVAHVHPHRFRRTVATMALKKGAGIEEVKELLRHEDIKTTVLYTQLDRENLKNKHSIIMD